MLFAGVNGTQPDLTSHAIDYKLLRRSDDAERV